MTFTKRGSYVGRLFCSASWIAGSSPAMTTERRALLSRLLGAAAVLGHEIVHRRLHAALLVRNVGKRERHLGCGQAAQHHRVVDVAEMPDAEHLAGEAPEARAVRDIELLERQRTERLGVMTFGHQHGGDGR